ncbi:MAG: site-2 protease family protein [Chloroflexi bacterium]|nr:site-2 protease family protein [Chloroflexota bacterium]
MERLAIIPILGVLIIAHELGHFAMARMVGIVVEEFALGFPPRLWSTVRRGVRYSLNLIPFGAYVRLLGEEDPSARGSFAGQSKKARALVLAAGSGVNFLLAIGAFALAYGTGWPDRSNLEIRVAEIAAGSPAASSGIAVGDVVREVDGVPVRRPEDIRQRTQSRPGQPIQLVVQRDGGGERSLTLTPRADPPEGQGPLGVRLEARALPSQHDPLSSLAFGVSQALQIVGLTLAAPAMAIRGELPLDMVRPIGLPGMTQLAGDAAVAVVQTGWLFPVLMLAGVFSAGLAVANLLPLPALDGGRLFFVLVEAIRGRRISPEREGVIHAAGLVLLISLMVVISFYDVVEPLPGIDWGAR